MDVNGEKKRLRAHMRDVLSNLGDAALEKKSRDAAARLASLPAFYEAKTILAYKAMRHECDPDFAVREAVRAGKRVAFPVCARDNGLRLFVPHAPESFRRGAYGIMEPDANQAVEIEPLEVDFIIVPGLAFDRRGGRLGRGEGYYDRLIAKTSAVKVGFAFDVQIVEHVPKTLYDIYMDKIVTDRTTFYL